MFFTLLALIHTKWIHAIPFVNFQGQYCDSMFQILRSSAVKVRDFCNNYLKLIYQPNNALNNIQLMISTKLLHVSAAGCNPQSLILVMNCVLLSEFFSLIYWLWEYARYEWHKISEMFVDIRFQKFSLWYLKCLNFNTPPRHFWYLNTLRFSIYFIIFEYMRIVRK
jgi:hypothetical protein